MNRPILALLVATCVACVPQEQLPAPAYAHVEGDPATAGRALTVRSFGTDGAVSGVSDDFAAGDAVRLDLTSFAGERGLTVNGVRCTGRFTTEVGRETDVTLRVTEDGCETIVERTHDLVEVANSAASVVYGAAPGRSTIDVVSLDDPPRNVPANVAADESGWFVIVSFPPGRYRLDVRSDAGVAASATVVVKAGETEHVDLRRPGSPAPS